MITYIKTVMDSKSSFIYEICEYHKPDNYEEELEKWKNNKSFFGKGPAPVLGGPIIAYFNNEQLADEYIKFKTEQLSKK